MDEALGQVIDEVSVSEIRLLEGPNLYFTRPAVKVTLTLAGYATADTTAMQALAAELGMRRASPGRPGTAQRHRFLARLVAHLLRRVAIGAGTRLGVRSRTGTGPDAVVVAYPWRNSERARALATALGPMLTQLLHGDPPAEVMQHAVDVVRAAPLGRTPVSVRPRIPVASITGTNGKTSTTRLLAHISMTAGRRTGWSSTEGVYLHGEQVIQGDYSGPSGARHVLDDRSVEVGILETARGGLLLKGMGVTRNDVSVVTNVSADHLGTQGIDTVDQLAEVKAIITTVTRRSGWVVLNGDDPRVRAMATRATGRIWMFSTDPDSPALRETVGDGGRGLTVLDGAIVILRRDADPDRLVRIADVPLTLAGLSRHNIANALAGTAAALALELPREAVIEGLRSFAPDTAHNPGRMNTFTVPVAGGGHGTIILDLAHNEAGLEALLDVADGLRLPGSRVHLVLGGVGDRSDEILTGLGEIAGRRADRVQIAHKGKYLRGRSVEDLEQRFVDGLAAVGAVASGSSPTEVDGVAELCATMADGDVVAVMSHAERVATIELITSLGGSEDRPSDVRRKAIAARGEHEFELELTQAAELEATARVDAVRVLLAGLPGDARLEYELGAALEVAPDAHAGAASASTRLDHALAAYRRAVDAGLRDPHRFHAQLSSAVILRAKGETDQAVRILDELTAQRPASSAVAALRALAALDAGRAPEALRDLVRHSLQQASDPDDARYRDVISGP